MLKVFYSSGLSQNIFFLNRGIVYFNSKSFYFSTEIFLVIIFHVSFRCWLNVDDKSRHPHRPQIFFLRFYLRNQPNQPQIHSLCGKLGNSKELIVYIYFQEGKVDKNLFYLHFILTYPLYLFFMIQVFKHCLNFLLLKRNLKLNIKSRSQALKIEIIIPKFSIISLRSFWLQSKNWTKKSISLEGCVAKLKILDKYFRSKLKYDVSSSPMWAQETIIEF